MINFINLIKNTKKSMVNMDPYIHTVGGIRCLEEVSIFCWSVTSALGQLYWFRKANLDTFLIKSHLLHSLRDLYWRVPIRVLNCDRLQLNVSNCACKTPHYFQYIYKKTFQKNTKEKVGYEFPVHLDFKIEKPSKTFLKMMFL